MTDELIISTSKMRTIHAIDKISCQLVAFLHRTSIYYTSL